MRANHRNELAPPSGQCNVTVDVGPPNRNPLPAQLGQQRRGRMAVIVSLPDRYHGDSGSYRTQKGRVGVGAAVMRDLEDVGPNIRTVGEYRVLGLDLGIAGQQDSKPTELSHQHDGGVVGIRARSRQSGDRAKNVDTDPTDHEMSVQGGRVRDQSMLGQQRCHASGGRRGLAERRDHNLTDRPSVQRTRQTTNVVEVKVGQDQQVDPFDVKVAQAPVDGKRLGPDVDDNAGARPGVEHDRIALTDVAGDHQPARWRPATDQAPNGNLYHQCRTKRDAHQ